MQLTPQPSPGGWDPDAAAPGPERFQGRAGHVPAALGGVGHREEWETLRPMARGDVLQERPRWSVLGEFPMESQHPKPHPAAPSAPALPGQQDPVSHMMEGKGLKTPCGECQGIPGCRKEALR